MRDALRREHRLARLDRNDARPARSADARGEESVLESLRALRTQLADVSARLDVAEAVAETAPHRKKYLLLNHRLSRRLVVGFQARGSTMPSAS